MSFREINHKKINNNFLNYKNALKNSTKYEDLSICSFENLLNISE